LGERVVEVLKQNKNSPLKIEEQVVIIFAVINRYLKNIEIGDIGRFESELFEFINNSHPDIFESIRTSKDLTNENKSSLKDVLDSFVKKFIEDNKAQ